MPPQVAFAAWLAFLFAVLIIHSKDETRSSPLLWLPSAWLAIIGSRPIGLWLYSKHSAEFSESTLDMMVYSAFIAAALVALARRRQRLSHLVGGNWALALLLCYVGASVLWAETPYAALKQYVKLIGMVAMALIIATDDDAATAIQVAIKRCAYLLIPASILLIKYYPLVGLKYEPWAGGTMFVGVTTHKNSLGALCMVVGLTLAWSLLKATRQGWSWRRPGLIVDCVMLALTVHLLILSDSKTSLVCFMASVGLLAAQGAQFVRRHVGAYVAVAVVVFAILELSVGLSGQIAIALGRDPTLTNRTTIWRELLPLAPNVWVGAGYNSFWNVERQSILAAAGVQATVISSHNGFLEVYLTLGLLGLSGYLLVLGTAYRNALKLLARDHEFGRFTYSSVIAILLFNITEAGFRGLGLVHFMFLFVAIKVLPQPVALPANAVRADRQAAARVVRGIAPASAQRSDARKQVAVGGRQPLRTVLDVRRQRNKGPRWLDQRGWPAVRHIDSPDES
jgi:O-antigen ligase